MSKIDLDRLASALNLSPAQRAQLESLARAAGPAAGAAAAPAAEAKLRIHLTPGESLREGAAARTQQPPFVASMLARLSPELRKTLRDIEPQVLAWINSSPANALQFTTDPLGALRKAVPKLDAKALAELTRLRAQSQQSAAGLHFPGVDLKSITVDAKPGPRQPSAGGKGDAPGRAEKPTRADAGKVGSGADGKRRTKR